MFQIDEREELESLCVSLEYDVKVQSNDSNYQTQTSLHTVMGPPSGIPEVLGMRGKGGQQQGREVQCWSVEIDLAEVAAYPTIEQGTTVAI